MALPTSKASSWTAKDVLRLRGRVLVTSNRGRVHLQAWPRKRGKKATPNQLAWRQWFSTAARASKLAEPEQRDWLNEQTAGTGLYWRDVVEMAMRGKLIVERGQYRVSVPTAFVYSTAPQALTNGVFLNLTYNNFRWDTNSFRPSASGGYLVCKTPGLYLALAQVDFTTTSGTGFRQATLDMGDLAPITHASQVAAAGQNIRLTLLGLMYLRFDQRIAVYAQCNTTGQSANLRYLEVIGMTPETVM